MRILTEEWLSVASSLSSATTKLKQPKKQNKKHAGTAFLRAVGCHRSHSYVFSSAVYLLLTFLPESYCFYSAWPFYFSPSSCAALFLLYLFFSASPNQSSPVFQSLQVTTYYCLVSNYNLIHSPTSLLGAPCEERVPNKVAGKPMSVQHSTVFFVISIPVTIGSCWNTDTTRQNDTTSISSSAFHELETEIWRQHRSMCGYSPNAI